MTIHIACVRDPDAPNGFTVFPAGADVLIYDIRKETT